MVLSPIPNTPPEVQFREEVLPSYNAYMEDMTSVWKAKAASYFAGHFAEWVFLYYETHDPSRVYEKKTANQFRKHIANLCPDFQIIWEVALTSKHRFQIYNPTGHLVPSSTGAFMQRGPGLWMPTCNRYFDDVLKNVVVFWWGWIDPT